MLSYRHEFHAGNHADVFKHLCQSFILQKMTEKNKPLCYLDTHASAGFYDLTSAMASKTNEFASGIDKLLAVDKLPTELGPYLNLVTELRQQQQYPGSAAIAQALLREQDKMVLMELHNNEVDNLRTNLGRDRRVAIHHRDGLEGALAISPPTPSRGLVLIDPPYEVSDEYQQVSKTIAKLHKKWPVAVIALWYPLLASKRNKAPALIERLLQSQPSSLFTAELWVEAQQAELGMYGSGMAFINLPWQVDHQINQLLPLLVAAMGNQQAGWRSQWLIEPS